MQFPGAIYHVRSRGNSKQDIFLCNGDRWTFLKILETVVEKHAWLCHGYCLMTNHYHLLIETPRGNLSRGMKVLNGTYAQAVNRRHGRTGHVYEGRFRSKVVEKESHLLELFRYIALNPVRAGLVTDPADWPWSSCNDICGEARPALLATTEIVLSYFDNSRDGNGSFREYLLEGLDMDVCRDGLPDHLRLEGDPKPAAERPPLGQIIRYGLTGPEQRLHAAAAVLDHGYRIKEVAQHLGVANSTVSRAVKRQRDQRSRADAQASQ